MCVAVTVGDGGYPTPCSIFPKGRKHDEAPRKARDSNPRTVYPSAAFEAVSSTNRVPSKAEAPACGSGAPCSAPGRTEYAEL